MDISKSVCAIDLSHQNSEFDWSKLNQAIKIVILKASQGAKFKDATFSAHSKKVRAAGLVLGTYHFLNFTDSAQDQTNNFLQVCKNNNVDFSQVGTLPPIVDIEDQVPESLNATITRNRPAAIQLIKDYLNIIEHATGRKPIIYSYKSFWTETMLADFSAYPLWVASYQNTPPGMFGNWKNYTLWQFSQRGSHVSPNDGGGIDWSVLQAGIDIKNII